MKDKIIVIIPIILGLAILALSANTPHPQKQTQTTTQSLIIITQVPKKHTITIVPGRGIFMIQNGTTYIPDYVQFTRLTKIIRESADDFKQIGTDLITNFSYCPKFNDPANFVKTCGNCLDFLLIRISRTPFTVLLIVQPYYTHVAYVTDSTVYDLWYTFPLDYYLSNLGNMYYPTAVYVITFYANRVDVTTTTWTWQNVDGLYIFDGTLISVTNNRVYVNGAPVILSPPLGCKNFTTVLKERIILGCTQYTLHPYRIVNGVTYYTNRTLGIVQYIPKK